MRLILAKGYDAITVQEIIDEADVGRSTFYAHYTSKEDLLRKGFVTLRAELAEAQRAARKGDGTSEGEPLAFSLAMFEHAAQYADVYRAIAGKRGGAAALDEIRKALFEVVRKELAGLPEDGLVSKDIRLEFVVSAFLVALTWWLERRPRLKPVEIDATFRRLVLGGIGPAIGAGSPPALRSYRRH